MQIHTTYSLDTARLTVRDLTCRRGLRELFTELDLDLRAGEVVWVRGHNGRGKTSLLRLVAGIAKPERGQILFAERQGGDVSGVRRPVVFIGHDNALKDDLTVSEALGFLLRIHGREHDEQSIAAALARWDMLGQRNALVRSLSQGQRRRVALARLAVESEPIPWVLDEPFDALDTNGVQRLNELLAEHLERGGCVLITGHQSALSPALRQRDFDLDLRAEPSAATHFVDAA